MDFERLLISAIVADRNINDAIDGGIRPDFFKHPENRQMFETILTHKSEYGEVPSYAMLKADFPACKLLQPEDSYSALVARVRENHVLSELRGFAASLVDDVSEGDAVTALSNMAKIQRQLQSDRAVIKDTDVTQTVMDRLHRYSSYRSSPNGMRGIPTGFNFLDKVTLGWQPGQLITYIGPPGSGKSTMLLHSAIASQANGTEPLFIGFEMTNEEQEERYDAMTARINHLRLRSGKLKTDEWKKLERAMHQRSELPPFIFSADSSSTTTVSAAAAKIEQHKPGIVFIDGVYMMDDDFGCDRGTPQALTNITRSFKRLAMQFPIPIIITTQVLEGKLNRKKGIDTQSIGYSSSFAQDSDYIIGVLPTDDNSMQRLNVVKSRNSGKPAVFVKWDWDTGEFTEHEENEYEPDDSDTDRW